MPKKTQRKNKVIWYFHFFLFVSLGQSLPLTLLQFFPGHAQSTTEKDARRKVHNVKMPEDKKIQDHSAFLKKKAQEKEALARAIEEILAKPLKGSYP